jgi:pyruvate dehydrogenase E2 component (dihydrolipoamide acetyltransferase)
MPVDLVMPQLGLTMTEGKVLQWYKNVGEPFRAGELLFEVETDKVNMDVEATEDGSLIEILASLNETLPVSTVIARYLRPNDTAEAAQAAARHPAVSPRARRAAARAGISLDTIRGTGPNGRIVEADVLAVVDGRSPKPEPAAPLPVAQPQPPAAPSRSRRAIAERMTQSFQTAPHFYLSREIDAGELVALKRMLSTALAKRGEIRISLTDLLIRAMALAIARHPEVNASWREDHVETRSEIVIGIAVAREDGLIVPVLRDLASTTNLGAIAQRRHSLLERARAGHLSAADFSVASATLSNLGMYGVDQFQAILNPPESLIVATGSVRDRVVARNGASTVRPTMFCTASVDHRVLDGAQAARFLATFAELLENPGELLLAAESRV